MAQWRRTLSWQDWRWQDRYVRTLLGEERGQEDLPKGPEDFLKEITFEGDERFQRKLRELCPNYSDIFSDQLAEKPASLKPFEINIPLELWEKDENRTPVRPQSSTKDVVLKENLDEMLASGVIERSDAAYYSYPVIVTKSPGKYRTCIDDRPLSRCLKPASFLLPNIKHLFERIGYKKPDIFGVMDLTAGYHQASLHPAHRSFHSIRMLCGGLSVYETALWSVSCPLLLLRADGNGGPLWSYLSLLRDVSRQLYSIWQGWGRVSNQLAKRDLDLRV